MNPKISIIVPVYKVEPYLRRCVSSLRNQTLQEIEIILVDDGSPDNCGAICDEYALIDSRIKVIHQENQGLSAARNVGIQHVSSKYIMFVDSDDWVAPDYCLKPYQIASSHNAALIFFLTYLVKPNKQPKPSAKADQTVVSISKSEAYGLLESSVGNVAWNKLYEKNLFNDISFPLNRFCEDIGTLYRIVAAANTIYFLKQPLYYYFIRTESLSHSVSSRFMEDYFEMSFQKYEAYLSDTDSAIYAEPMIAHTALCYCFYMVGKNGKHLYESEMILQRADEIPSHLSIQKKIAFLCFKKCRFLFDFLSRFIRFLNQLKNLKKTD